MFSDYVSAALRLARYEILADDHSYYGEIPGFDGVYANADSLEECREELRGTLEDWILFRVSRQLPLPVVAGIELAVGAPV
jgi:predicted RNase H-like HicB family nuclease